MSKHILKTLTMSDWRQLQIPKYSSPQIIEDLVERFVWYSDDVSINTYPKSGTTLTQEIVWLLLNQDLDKAKSTKLIHRSAFIDYGRSSEPISPQERALTLPRPRVLKTHLSAPFHYRHLQDPNGPKVIVVFRNLKDSLVSGYFHLSSSKHTNADGNTIKLDQMVQEAVLGNSQQNEDYFSYTLSWWNLRDHPRILILFYEDLVTDKKVCVKKIAEFLNISVSDEFMDAVVNHTSFSEMKNNVQVNFSMHPDAKNEWHNNFSFIRKGEIGDWKNYLTVAQSEALDKAIEDKLGGSGLKFRYE